MKHILFMLCFGCLSLYAQDYALSGSIGISTMQLEDLAKYQSELIDQSMVPAKNLSSFPAYSYFTLSAINRLSDRIRLGLVFRGATTGAHANYTDYSGQFNINQLVNTYVLSAGGYYRLWSAGSLDVSAMANAGLGITRDLVTKTISTPRLITEESVRLRSVSPNLLAGFEALYNLNAVAIGIEAGYLLNIPVSLKIIEGDSYSGGNIEPSGSIKANSSGWRAGLKIVLPLTGADQRSAPVQILE